MAKILYEGYLTRRTGSKIDYLVETVDKYSPNALAMSRSRTCKAYSIGMEDIADAVEERTGVPSLFIEGDFCDSRLVDRSVIDESIDSFMELLGCRKQAG